MVTPVDLRCRHWLSFRRLDMWWSCLVMVESRMDREMGPSELAQSGRPWPSEVLLGVLGGLVGACTVLQNMHVT